jgi:hypothetical protein
MDKQDRLFCTLKLVPLSMATRRRFDFSRSLRLLPTQFAEIPGPEGQNQAKTGLSKNAIARLLFLLKTKQSSPSLPLLNLQLIGSCKIFLNGVLPLHKICCGRAKTKQIKELNVEGFTEVYFFTQRQFTNKPQSNTLQSNSLRS